jgi:hypothetical protein
MRTKKHWGRKKESLSLWNSSQRVEIIFQKIAAGPEKLEKLESNVGKLWDAIPVRRTLGDFSDGYADANIDMVFRKALQISNSQEQELYLSRSLKDIEKHL